MRLRSFLLSIVLLFIFVDESTAESLMQEIFLQKEELASYSLLKYENGYINWLKLDELMDELEKMIEVSPIDATLGNNMEIIDEIVGSTLERNKFQSNFLEAFYLGEDNTIQIPRKTIYPRIDRQTLQEILQKRLGTYTTFYNSANKERSTNITLSAEAIHGTVIFPGEVFSFNRTVGERTEDRGYKRARVIVQGEFAEDIGGGICQVSSTLFNAVDLRGIQMVERYTHSRRVPYVPPGRDATVSWWGPDFSFKNLYNEPVVITARAAYGILSISIYSSETVEYFQPE